MITQDERERITPRRDMEMNRYWNNETETPESRAWRNDLTPIEAEVIAIWDKAHAEGRLRKWPDVWEIITEPNTVDNYGNPCRHARCPYCGFTWTSLYHVKMYFKHCPNCGQKLKYPE